MLTRKKNSRITQEVCDALRYLLQAGVGYNEARQLLKIGVGTGYMIKRSGYDVNKYDELVKYYFANSRKNVSRDKVVPEPVAQRTKGVTLAELNETLLAIWTEIKALREMREVKW